MTRGSESGPPGVSIQPAKLTDTVQHEKYSELVARLNDDFQQRFEDFGKPTDIMKLLSDPFQVDHTGSAVKYQMELTDIQNDSDLKRNFGEQDLLSFDSGCFIRQLPQSVIGRQEFHFCLVAPTAASNCFRE